MQTLLNELHPLIAALGEEGGIVSPSVYDTAQILRLSSSQPSSEETVAWLLGQQLPDGGWGQPSIPAERTVPTLAALLALKAYGAAQNAEQIAAGVAFLETQQHVWRDIHIDLVPIAAEMIVPYLLDEAEQAGLLIDRKPYRLLYEMRRLKLERLAKARLQANTAPIYSWEALGLPFTTEVLDPHTGVGHSPAATATWLKQARSYGVDPVLCAQAEAYLARAHAATQSDIPGLYPVVYPIRGFELTYGLYALLLTGLMDHAALRPVIDEKLDALQSIIRQENGISFGAGFVPDVDDTGVGVTVLCAAGRDTDPQWVQRFWHHDHFYTYVHELNPSVFSNAHALHALAQCGTYCDRTEAFLLDRQTDTGRWLPDKWHTSWRSTTMEAVVALAPLENQPAVERAVEALIEDQRADGGWGEGEQASALESAYSVITLQLAQRHNCELPMLEQALNKARRWYQTNWIANQDMGSLWLGKVAYSPLRVDRVYDLSVRLRLCLDAATEENHLTQTNGLDAKEEGLASDSVELDCMFDRGPQRQAVLIRRGHAGTRASRTARPLIMTAK